MDFGSTLMYMFPDIPPSQYELIQQEDGTVKITRWDSTETPQPTEQDVIDYWTSHQAEIEAAKTVVNPIIDIQTRISDLEAALLTVMNLMP